jgi:hypothetical protein
MQSTETPEADSAARVVPPARSAAPWRVVTVQAKQGLRLDVTFADGTTGEVLLRKFLEGPAVAGTLFESLRDPTVFAQARVELGAVTWPNGADLAPDTMYDAIRAQGRWAVEA